MISIAAEHFVDRPGSDHSTITHLTAGGALQIGPIARPADPSASTVELGVPVPAGPAVVLLHEENPAMTDLRQLSLHRVRRCRHLNGARTT